MIKSSIIFLLISILFSGICQAEAIKNSEFLKFSKGQRYWWFSGAYMSLGHAVFLEDETKAQCVWKWFFEDEKKKEELLLDSFKKYPDHTPTSIIIGLLRKDCKVFLKSK